MSAPWWVRLVQGLVKASWWEGMVPALLWVKLGLVPLVGKAMLGGVFWDGCRLSMTLGSLSADGWGCVHVLLVVRPEAFQHWNLQAVGWG